MNVPQPLEDFTFPPEVLSFDAGKDYTIERVIELLGQVLKVRNMNDIDWEKVKEEIRNL